MELKHYYKQYKQGPSVTIGELEFEVLRLTEDLDAVVYPNITIYFNQDYTILETELNLDMLI